MKTRRKYLAFCTVCEGVKNTLQANEPDDEADALAEVEIWRARGDVVAEVVYPEGAKWPFLWCGCGSDEGVVIWKPVSGGLPDADRTVLIHTPDDAEPVWMGFFDGEQWLGVDGFPISAAVIEWAEFPDPPPPW